MGRPHGRARAADPNDCVRLPLVYLVVFSGLTLFLTAYITNNTAELLDLQISDTIDSEINSLSDQYERGGSRQLVAVDLCSRRPGASLYLVADSSGRTVVGNVADPPLSILGLSDGDTTSVTYQRLDGDASRRYEAIVRRRETACPAGSSCWSAATSARSASSAR